MKGAVVEPIRASLLRELSEMAAPPPGGSLSVTSEWIRGVGWCNTFVAIAGTSLTVGEHQSWLETAMGRGRQP